jgi:hypothetical protein
MKPMKNDLTINESKSTVIRGRRNFLKMSGLAVAGTGLLLVGCNDDEDDNNQQQNNYPGMRDGVFDLGGGDLGILTYAYALEQLEADFSTRVVNNAAFATAFSSTEQQAMIDIYNHEVMHREFFRNYLTDVLPDPENQLLQNLTFDYGTLNFGDRTAVLNMAKSLEATGIAAYNGAGRYLTNPQHLLLAGKIVSVEGRHAAAISMMIDPNSDQFAPTPLDPAQMPSQVLNTIDSMNLIQTNFSANFLS